MADKRKVKNPDPKKPGDKVTRNLVIGMIAFVLIAGFGDMGLLLIQPPR
jgi:hypothetical protein